jgi:hypothetical protein
MVRTGIFYAGPTGMGFRFRPGRSDLRSGFPDFFSWSFPPVVLVYVYVIAGRLVAEVRPDLPQHVQRIFQ